MMPVVCPCARSQLEDRFGPTSASDGRPGDSSAGARRSAERRSAQRQTTPAEHAAEQVQRRRQPGRAAQLRPRAVDADEWDLQRRLDLDVAVRADPLQKRERLAVAAEHRVLTVVDQLAGVAVLERRRASAEPRPRIEDEHANAAFREQRRGTQPREAAADDDHRGDRRWRPPGPVPILRIFGQICHRKLVQRKGVAQDGVRPPSARCGGQSARAVDGGCG